jgi:hypothetical protein
VGDFATCSIVSLSKTPWRSPDIPARLMAASHAWIETVSGHFLGFSVNDGIRIMFQDAKRRI